MANFLFTFQVEGYFKNADEKPDAPVREYAVGVAQSTGSVETRARRRLLEMMHSHGLFARTVTLVDREPIVKGQPMPPSPFPFPPQGNPTDKQGDNPDADNEPWEGV